MTGNVVLVQDQNVVQGDRLVIDTRTGQRHPGLRRPGPQRRRRVRGVFYPSQAQAGQTQARPPAEAAARP